MWHLPNHNPNMLIFRSSRRLRSTKTWFLVIRLNKLMISVNSMSNLTLMRHCRLTNIPPHMVQCNRRLQRSPRQMNEHQSDDHWGLMTAFARFQPFLAMNQDHFHRWSRWSHHSPIRRTASDQLRRQQQYLLNILYLLPVSVKSPWQSFLNGNRDGNTSMI